MDDRRLDPVLGLAGVVLFVASIVVIESGAVPDASASGSELAAYLDGALGRLAVALVLWGLGTVALLWFLDGVREHVSLASDRYGRLLFVFGFGAALLLLASFVPDLAGAFASDEREAPLEAGAAQALGALGDGFFIAAELMVGGLYAMAALAALTTRALPAWLGWLSALFAVVAFIPPIGWAVLVWGFPLWILVVSAVLWRRPVEQVATP